MSQGPCTKRLRVQVIDIFHGIGQERDGSPAIGFFAGDDDEHLVLDVEDCPVTAIQPEGEMTEAAVVHDTNEDKDQVHDDCREVLPPVEYHLGDALDVCREVGNPVGVQVDFDYLASQITQASTQDPDVCIQSLVERGSKRIGTLAGQVVRAAEPSDTHVLLPPQQAQVSPPGPCLPQPSLPAPGGSIFQTGNGVTIPVDPERKAAAVRLLGGFGSAGRGASLGSGKASSMVSPGAGTTGGSMFSTGAGKALAIDPARIAANRQLLDSGVVTGGTPAGLMVQNSAASRRSIFSTGAGASIKIDPERLVASRRLLGSDAERCASGAAASPAPSASTQAKVIGSIFCTGAGSNIHISKEKLDAAKRILDDSPGLRGDGKASTPMMSRFAPGRLGPKMATTSLAASFDGKQLNQGNLHAKTPGHDLLRRQRPMSSAGAWTPYMTTPQNTLGGVLNGRNSVMTPGSSAVRSDDVLAMPRLASFSSGSKRHRFDHPNQPGQSPFSRDNLPFTPYMAAKFAFSGMYGPGDVRAHLLSKGAIPEVVSDAWVRNHYKWIVWKLALVEMYKEMQANRDGNRDRCDTYRLGSHLNYGAVKEELSRRYDKEYVEGKRSFIKALLQRDISFCVPCVLKVATVSLKSTTNNTCTLELTDGWYSIYAECDKEILGLVRSGKLFVGQKVRIFGAELSSGSPGDPLEAVKETRMILAYNQVHPVSHSTRLGAQPERYPITPLSCISDKGGKVSRTVVSVLRLFPPMVWSKLPSGVSTFQTAGKAGRAEASLEGELERIYSQVKNDIERKDLNVCKSWLAEGRVGGLKQVQRLYAMMMVSGDEQFAEGLNTQDKADLKEFVLQRRAEMDEERKKKVREVLEAEVPGAASVKSTPCRTMLVGEVSFGRSDTTGKIFQRPMEHLRPEEYPSVSLLTVWNSEGIKEGDIISVSSIESFDRMISSQTYQGPFLGALKHLKTGITSEIEVLPVTCVPPERVVQSMKVVNSNCCGSRDGQSDPQVMTTRALLVDMDKPSNVPNLFDIDVLVALTSPVHLEENCYHRQWVFGIDYVEDAIGEVHPWVLAIKLSGPQDAIKWFKKHDGGFMFHFGNVSLMGYDTEQRFVQLQGSMGTELGTVVSSELRLREILDGNKKLLASLKTRLTKLMDL